MTTYNQAVAYNSAIKYNGGASADTRPMDHLRLDVAFSTNPDDANPNWVDLTSRLQLPPGVVMRRGRANEYDTIQTGTLSCTLENIDGALSPDNTSSPYYPNVVPQRRIRLTYRDPSTVGNGNLLSAENASFEGGTVGTWSPANGATLSNSATRAQDGTKSLRIAWPTASAGALPWGQVSVSGLSAGRQYTASAYVWTPDSPNVAIGIYAVVNGTATTTKSAWARVTVTFTATSSTHLVLIFTGQATTSGQGVWVDAVQIDEGATAGTFTTSSPSIVPKFDGYVDEWPLEWQGGSDLYSASQINAADILSRIGARQNLRSVVVETMALDSPLFHYPLSEPAGSTQVSDVSPSAAKALLVQAIGAAGGTIDFGTATGVPTDGASAVTLTPVSPTSGYFIGGDTGEYFGYQQSSFTISATINTTSASQTVWRLSDNWGSYISLEMDAAGHLLANFAVSPVIGGVIATATTSTAYNDGRNHTVAVRVSQSGGTVTIQLVIDGTNGPSATQSTWGIQLYTRMSIGGHQAGGLFTGAICHVVGYSSAVSTARLNEHWLSQTTGFAGERSDQRIARIASWAGIPTSRLNLDTGMSTTVAHLDCTGLNPLDYMRKVEATEAGVLFADRSGNLTLFSRSRNYAATSPAVSFPSYMLGEDVRLAQGLQQVVNEVKASRANGLSVTLTDSASIASFGNIATSIDLLTTSDNEVMDAASWRLNTAKTPVTRFTNLTLDAFTDPTYSPSIRDGVTIGAHLQATAMPSQAASTKDVIVQGFTESITHEAWGFDINTSPYQVTQAFTLDDATLGKADGPGVLIY